MGCIIECFHSQNNWDENSTNQVVFLLGRRKGLLVSQKQANPHTHILFTFQEMQWVWTCTIAGYEEIEVPLDVQNGNIILTERLLHSLKNPKEMRHVSSHSGISEKSIGSCQNGTVNPVRENVAEQAETFSSDEYISRLDTESSTNSDLFTDFQEGPVDDDFLHIQIPQDT